jgi:hypothetical protein
MAEYAVIKNDLVENVIVAESMEVAVLLSEDGVEIVESINGEPGVGWTRVNGTWVNPIPTVPPDYAVQVPSVSI